MLPLGCITSSGKWKSLHVHRESLVLFVQDRENSERFVIQPGFANCSTSEPAVRHESSRDRRCDQEVGDSYHHRPRTKGSRPGARPLARRCTKLRNYRSWRGPCASRVALGCAAILRLGRDSIPYRSIWDTFTQQCRGHRSSSRRPLCFGLTSQRRFRFRALEHLSADSR